MRRIATFRVQIDTVDEEIVGAKITLPHHDGMEFSHSFTESELFAWIRREIKKYLRAQMARAHVLRRRAQRERRAFEAQDSR